MSDDGNDRTERLERRVQRERRARCQAELLLEAKSRELYRVNQELSELAIDLEARVESRTRELAEARERAMSLADGDQLTGLANRAYFIRHLEAWIERSAATGARFAVLLLDLDRFKEINDTLGHEAGDMLLCHVAARLRACAGATDVAARLGGDEFALLVSLSDGADVDRIAETIRAAIEMPISYRDRLLEASASIGVALWPDEEQPAGEPDLQRRADIALYRSKIVRATHTRYRAEMGREVEARFSLGAELSNAIRGGQIEAWCQPIVAAGRVVSLEALARWRHPTRGLLGPASFLELAAERRLVHDLFTAMMHAACPTMRRMIACGPAKSLSVNVSPSQFKLGSLADDVMALLRELDFPPAALTLEITEEVLMNDIDRARAQLQRLENIGIQIALDDFGVGYSNIGYLRRLPLHVLKLDRSLTADVVAEPKARSIVAALVELADALNLQLVGEGVETHAQAAILEALGCTNLQGYLFGVPMPLAQFERQHGGG